ncbi:MAG: S41 family peptidase, partial [Bacteroidota bacterium]
VNVDSVLADQIPLGSRIVSVGGQPAEAYVAEHIHPYLAAGGTHVLARYGTHEILQGPTDQQVTFTIRTPTDEERTLTLDRDRTSADFTWAKKAPRRALSSFKMLDEETGYLALNSFGNGDIVAEFKSYLPELRKCSSLVIDLRQNGGGNSGNGYRILEYFLAEPVVTSAWRTREARAAFRAWGKPYENEDPQLLGEWNAANRQEYLGERWYVSAPDTLQPVSVAERLSIPVAVLVSNYTASAAEDFLVAADPVEQFTYVGEPSYGSTGQPLMLSLPGGGNGRVCTKRDTYADGREFVGPGVAVDVTSKQSVADYLADKDVVLERALSVLRGK